jgi:hypothetical protein
MKLAKKLFYVKQVLEIKMGVIAYIVEDEDDLKAVIAASKEKMKRDVDKSEVKVVKDNSGKNLAHPMSAAWDDFDWRKLAQFTGCYGDPK